MGRGSSAHEADSPGPAPSPLVLVVEDEPSIAQAIVARLEAEGFTTETAADGPEAVRAAIERRPDLLVLDLNLPGFDGLEVCRQVHANPPPGSSTRVPVVMLTARSDETDLLVGLGVGADDYLTKPFSMKELVARIRAVLRRTTPEPAHGLGAEPASASGLGLESGLGLGAEPVSELVSEPVSESQPGSSADRGPVMVAADVHLDAGRRLVWHRDELVHLTPTEFDLLRALHGADGAVLSRAQLLDRVWGYRDGSGARTVDSHIRSIRRKLADDVIRTVHGVGYSLQTATDAPARAVIQTPARAVNETPAPAGGQASGGEAS